MGLESNENLALDFGLRPEEVVGKLDADLFLGRTSPSSTTRTTSGSWRLGRLRKWKRDTFRKAERPGSTQSRRP